MVELDSAKAALVWRLALNKAALSQRLAEFGMRAAYVNAAEAVELMAHEEAEHATDLEHVAASSLRPIGIWALPTPSLRVPLGDWYDFVALSWLFDGALRVVVTSLRESTDHDLARIATRIMHIEPYHATYSATWVKRIGSEGGPPLQALTAASMRIWDETLCWLGPQDDSAAAALYAAGVVDAMPDVWRARVLSQVGPVAEEAHLRLPLHRAGQGNAWVLTRPLPWERWDDERWELRPEEATA